MHVTGDFTEDLQFPPAATLSNDLGAIPNGRDIFVGKICPECCGGANLVLNGDFEDPVIANNTFEKRSTVAHWNTTDSSGRIELWSGTFGAMLASHGNQHMEINSDHGDVTVSQTVCNLIPNCPLIFSYDAAGRPGYADNRFTASIEGGGPVAGGVLFSETSNPFPAAPGVWQHHTAVVYPPSGCVTIKFRGYPATGVDGGAHIDNVSLTQCCSAAPALDGDGDGIPDNWELAHGLNPYNAVDALLDPDGDGQTNLAEYLAGTDPHDLASWLHLDQIEKVNGSAILHFTMPAYRSYTIQYKNLLTDPNWIKLIDLDVQSFTSAEQILDPAPLPASRFYRVVTPKEP